MATQFRLAALGHTMETGRVVEWHIAEGSRVEEGQLLVSIETDKAVADIESPISGVLLRVVGQVDGEYDVGETLAWIGEEGEEVPDAPAEQPKAPVAERPAGSRATPVALRLAQRHGIDAEALPGTGPGGRVTKEDVQRAIDAGIASPEKAASEIPTPGVVEQPKAPAAGRSAGSRVTPVAQRLAQRHGIDAEALSGTGPGGRVTKEDVQRAVDAGTAKKEKAADETPAPGVEVIPLTGIRRTTAERLGAIWSQAPHVTEGIEVDFSAIQAARESNEDAWRDTHGVAPTINDFVLKATAEALKSHPRLNAALIDGASRFRVWWEIIIPLIKPGIAALAIFNFIQGWSAYLIPATFTVGTKVSTLPVFLNQFSGDTSLASWNSVAAMGLFQLIPVLIFFIFTQEALLNIYGGGAKGGA